MPEQTQNYDLTKQLQDEFYNRELDNQNLDLIDALIKALQDSKANGTDLVSLSNTLTQHFAAINPHSETESRTISVGSTHEFKTIQSAINSIKKDLGGRKITVWINDGIYSEEVRVEGFHNGELEITHATVNTKVHAYRIVGCLSNIVVSNGEITAAGNISKVSISRSLFVYLNWVRLVTPSVGYGVTVGGAMCTVQGCVIASQERGIDSNSNALVYSSGNSGTGNTIALAAYAGGSIHKNDFQPTGTTNESAWAGGAIR